MPFTPVFADLVRTFTSSVGTGPVAPGVALEGHRAFAEALGPGEQFYYSLEGVTAGGEWEVGEGTLLPDGTIARAPLASSNGNALVDLSPGTKTIALTVAAEWFDRIEAAAGVALAAEPAIAAGTTAQYWRGDKSWQPLDKAAIGLGAAEDTADADKTVLAATRLASALTVGMSGDVAWSVSFDGSADAGAAATIQPGAVGNAKLAAMAVGTIKGRAAGSGAGSPADLSPAQAKTLLAIGAGDVAGLAAVATSGSAADLAGGTLPAARMPALTGDVTTSAGGVATTLASVNGAPGSFGSATKIAQLTVNAKGLVTAASEVAIAPPAAAITGGAALTRTNDANVTLTLGGSPNAALLAAASLTLGWSGTLAVARGGTGGGTASGTLLDNIAGFAGTGHLVRTGAGVYAFRTLTGPAAGISVTNGDGVVGSPALALANDLAAIEGLAGTGLAARTGADSWTTRAIAGSASIAVTNGDGVTGNPTIAKPNGTAFPGSPSTGDFYYRTDRDVDYRFDGTRWLSTQLFTIDLAPTDFQLPITASHAAGFRGANPWSGKYDLYLIDIVFARFDLSPSGALSWTFGLVKSNVSSSATIASITAAADSANVWNVTRSAVNAVVTKDYIAFDGTATLNGGSASEYPLFGFTYRLVG